jgi:hypothetical protein
VTLLRDIQQAALDSQVDLADLLRKCKVLASRLKHAKLSEWVNRELNGYPDVDALPDYRKLSVQSLGHFSGPFGSGLRNAPIPVNLLPAQLRHFANEQAFTDPISALTEHANAARSSAVPVLQGKWPADVVAYVQRYHAMYENMVLADAWRVIPAAAVRGILDTVRTRVLDFVLAIEDEDPTAGDGAPGERPRLSNDKVTNIYNTTIHGGHANVGHHRGDSNMGDKYISRIDGSTVGAVAIGANAHATGSVTQSVSALTQEGHRAALKEAQAALVHDQDALDKIDDRLYEALGQFLRMARDIQVEQQALAEVQARMKDTLDDVWAQHAAKGLRAQTVPRTLEVAEALAKSPAMAEVLKNLLGP